MFKSILSQLNENHWYIIAAIIICALLIWLFGCQSRVPSLISPDKKVTREELTNESQFLLAQIKTKMLVLDRQDEVKKLIMDQASIFSQTGSFNPMGLLNTLVSVGAISFGLHKNQKLNAIKKNPPAAAAA